MRVFRPKYGYERTTLEYSTKVFNHSITISGLIPGTVYYYRAVSHGSLAISYEHSFTTLTPEEAAAAKELLVRSEEGAANGGGGENNAEFLPENGREALAYSQGGNGDTEEKH